MNPTSSFHFLSQLTLPGSQTWNHLTLSLGLSPAGLHPFHEECPCSDTAPQPTADLLQLANNQLITQVQGRRQPVVHPSTRHAFPETAQVSPVCALGHFSSSPSPEL